MGAEPLAEAGRSTADKAARQRRIAASIWFTVPGAGAVLALGYLGTAPLQGVAQASERLVLAVQWLLVASIPYVAVCLHITYARFAEGAHNPLLGQESERLVIHCRVMQNTLEQLAWFALCIVPLATLLSPSQVRIVPVACVFFAFARCVYWWGYLRAGTLGRAPGVQLTLALNVPLFVLALVLFARRLAS